VKAADEEMERLKELNTQLLTEATEAESLKLKLKEMEEELKNRSEIEKEIEPKDYEKMKKQIEDGKNDYGRLRRDFYDKVEHIKELKQQIESLKSVTEEEKCAKKMKDGAIFFCTRVNDFIEKTGGFVWLSEHIDELPDYERKSYIKAIEMVESWAFAMKANMKIYL
jgi:hypothetical protein